eukprot:949281-Rhodomonas_salina.1
MLGALVKAGAALEMDSNWHETDYEGLVYQDVTEDDVFMLLGTQAKQFAWDFSLEVERDRCKESVTLRWLLRQGQGRQFLGQLWKQGG